jgi:GTP-binding protein HflX
LGVSVIQDIVISSASRLPERAILARVSYRNDGWSTETSFEELALLCETAGLSVVGSISQNLAHPHPRSYLGKGKLDELAELIPTLEADVVVFDDELSPAQLRTVEEKLEVMIIDRPALILDIFAGRAVTHEGRLQVELAQLEYRLPRLTRMWTHLSRQGVGGVGLRGPGETQLEVDRRVAQTRIHQLKEDLGQVHRHRELYRERRRLNEAPVVALVGYTNAGKSTLLNRLSAAEVLAEDTLFATLDPTTRRVTLPSGQVALLTDTVGFIHNLPTTLVAAFRATLEEIAEASLLLHVVDISHPNAAEHVAAVEAILNELGVDDKLTIMVMNKIDRLSDGDAAADDIELPGNYAAISAQLGIGIDQLLNEIDEQLAAGRDFVDLAVCIPFNESSLVDLFHRAGHVDEVRYNESGAVLHGRLPVRLSKRFEPYQIENAAAH